MGNLYLQTYGSSLKTVWGLTVISDVPLLVSGVFVLITVFTVYLFLLATSWNRIVLITLIGFMILQVFLSMSGFYSASDTIPPRFMLMLLPSLVLMVTLFITKRGKSFIQELDLKLLTILHTIRVPIEFILWALFLNKVIPERMTFEGLNFDIFAGLTAPVVYYLYFNKNRISNKIVLGWNILSLGLLLNIVINAILSTPSVFQRFAFDQPNIAILHFPFVWLPSIVVPIVMFSHLAGIWRFTNKN